MSKRFLIIGLVAAAVLVLLSPLASSHPDGLERVAEDLGFIDRAEDPTYELLPDYTVPGVGNESLSTILAGLIGAGVVLAVTWGAGKLLSRGQPVTTDSGARPS